MLSKTLCWRGGPSGSTREGRVMAKMSIARAMTKPAAPMIEIRYRRRKKRLTAIIPQEKATENSYILEKGPRPEETMRATIDTVTSSSANAARTDQKLPTPVKGTFSAAW